MEAAFQWISEIWNACTSIVPHAVLCRKTHRGIMFTRSKTYVMEPGLHWYLPLWSEPELYPVVRQTLDLYSQCVMTKDNYTVVVSACVIYRVEDIEKLLVETYSPEETVVEVTMGELRSLVCDKTLQELQADNRTANTHLGERVRSRLKDFGIRVEKARLTDFAPTYPIRLFTDGQKNPLGG